MVKRWGVGWCSIKKSATRLYIRYGLEELQEYWSVHNYQSWPVNEYLGIKMRTLALQGYRVGWEVLLEME